MNRTATTLRLTTFRSFLSQFLIHINRLEIVDITVYLGFDNLNIALHAFI